MLTIYRNTSGDGTISFDAGTNVTTTTTAPLVITSGDTDMDGKPDMVFSSNSPNKIGIIRNNSSPGVISFAAQVDVAVNFNATNIAIGDLNNDGLPDLALAYSSGSISPVSVVLNTTTGNTISFAAKQDITSVGESPFPRIADMNGDGLPDIATSVTSVNLSAVDFAVLANNTVSSFSLQTKVTYGTGGLNNSALATDIDGDGKPDMVLANYNPGSLKVFRNRINEPTITSFTPTSAATGATVTITGINLSAVNAVTIGGKAVRSFNIVNSTAITAVVDTLSSANTYVKVAGAISADSLSGFTYIAAPGITSFTPTTVGASTMVTITGTDLGTATAVTFGGVPALSFTKTATTIQAVVGKGLSGDVSVTSPSGTTSKSGFVYTTQTPPGNMLGFSTSRVVVSTGKVVVDGSYTVEAWVMSTATSSTAQNIFSTRVASTGNTFDMKIATNGTIQGDIGNGPNWLNTSANTSLTIERNRWYHVAYVITQQGYTIYVNGLATDNGTFSGNPVLINSSYNKINLRGVKRSVEQ